ncbi:MAG: hypothetical protein IJG40_04005 [Oscillospiraceae bacterium]|nr:hypothetical protein [Oscillospiraceae bacterium]
MNKDVKNEEQELDLDLDKLEQVSGGGLLQDLINRIVNSGKAPEYKEILRTQGKAAAAAACCADNGDLCGFCAAAVTMLK